MNINETQDLINDEDLDTDCVKNQEIEFEDKFFDQGELEEFEEIEEPITTDTQEPRGIGGWLVLAAVWLILSMINILFTIINTYLPVISSDRLDVLSKPGNYEYSKFWKPTIFFELGCCSILLLLGIILLFLFFKRKRIFPKLYIGLLIFMIIFSIIDVILMSQIKTIASANFILNAAEQLIKPIVFAAVWITYLLKSVRVKNTFVR